MLQGWPWPRPRTCPRPSTLPILCSAVFFGETWAASPRWGGLAAVSAFSEKLPEANSFSFHLVRPAPLSGAQGPKSDVACLRFREEGRGTVLGKGKVCGKMVPLGLCKPSKEEGMPCWEMQSAGNCGCSSTPPSPTSAGPEPPPRPLSSAQLPACRGHDPFPVAWLHSGQKTIKLGTSSLLDTEPC